MPSIIARITRTMAFISFNIGYLVLSIAYMWIIIGTIRGFFPTTLKKNPLSLLVISASTDAQSIDMIYPDHQTPPIPHTLPLQGDILCIPEG